MLGDIAVGIHVAGAAIKFAHVAIGVEWIGCGHWNRSLWVPVRVSSKWQLLRFLHSPWREDRRGEP